MSSTTEIVVKATVQKDRLWEVVTSANSFSPRDRNYAKSVLHALDEEGRFMVVYTQEEYGYGRHKATGPSLDRLHKAILKYVTSYKEVDMVAAADTTLSQLLSRHGIPCPELDMFLRNRESVLRLIDKDRKRAKTVINIARHNEFGVERPSDWDPRVDRLLAEYKANIKLFYRTVKSDPAYDKYRAEVVKRDPQNAMGKFLSHVLMDIESQILASMTDFYGTDAVGSINGDALLLRGELRITECVAYVKEHTGWHQPLMEQSMERTDAEMELFQPDEGSALGSWEGLQINDYAEEEYATYISPHDGQVKTCIHPLTFSPGIRCLMVNAHMGLGKSEMTLQHLVKARLNGARRILFVSSRILQADDIRRRFGDLDIVHYKDAISEKMDLAKIDVLVIQLESLYKLMYDSDGREHKEAFELFDVFAFDEARQVIGQVVSVKTNGIHLKTNFAVLRLLMSKLSHKVILLDADLECDNMVYHVVSSIFKPEECELRRYMQHNPMARSIKLLDEPNVFADLCRHADTHGPDTRCMVVFRSKTMLLKVLAELQRLYPALKTLAVYDKCPSENVAHLETINESMKHFHFLMFTSKVTVGLDVQIQFQKVYAFCHERLGSTALNVTQGLGRARRVADTEIVMCVPSSSAKERTLTYDEALQDLLAKRALRQKYGDALCAELDVKDGKFNFVTSLHTALFASDHMMSQNPFEGSIRHLARQKHWPVVDERIPALAPLKLPGVEKARQDYYQALFKEVISNADLDEMEDNSWDDIKARAQSRLYENGDNEKADIIMLLEHTFDWSRQDAGVRLALVEALQDDDGKQLYRLAGASTKDAHKKQLTDAALYRRFLASPEDFKLLDLAKFVSSGMASDHIALHFQKFSQIRDMCELVGVQNVMEPNTFSGDKLELLIPLLEAKKGGSTKGGSTKGGSTKGGSTKGSRKVSTKGGSTKASSTKIATQFNNVLKAVGLHSKNTGVRLTKNQIYEKSILPMDRIYKLIDFVSLRGVTSTVKQMDFRLKYAAQRLAAKEAAIEAAANTPEALAAVAAKGLAAEAAAGAAVARMLRQELCDKVKESAAYAARSAARFSRDAFKCAELARRAAEDAMAAVRVAEFEMEMAATAHTRAKRDRCADDNKMYSYCPEAKRVKFNIGKIMGI